jgi:uncharacterized protein (DUF305 family)
MFTSKRFALLAVAAVLACTSGKAADTRVVQQSMADMSAPVTIPKGAVFTTADVHFMQGMIAHHAQAIYMSRMAKEHGANPRVLKFAEQDRPVDRRDSADAGLAESQRLSAPDTSSCARCRCRDTTAQLKELDVQGRTSTASSSCSIQHHEGASRWCPIFATLLAAQT